MISQNHPLYELFLEKVQAHMSKHIGTHGYEDTSLYLTQLLAEFVRTDSLYKIANREGQRLESIIEMLAEGDVRLNANSFEREREVHKHIGDFILFWSSVHPKHLQRLKLESYLIGCDYAVRAKDSYHLVSTFNHPPYQAEAPVFAKLAQEFEAFQFVLRLVGRDIHLYAA